MKKKIQKKKTTAKERNAQDPPKSMQKRVFFKMIHLY